jgi:histone H3/H4
MQDMHRNTSSPTREHYVSNENIETFEVQKKGKIGEKFISVGNSVQKEVLFMSMKSEARKIMKDKCGGVNSAALDVLAKAMEEYGQKICGEAITMKPARRAKPNEEDMAKAVAKFTGA